MDCVEVRSCLLALATAVGQPKESRDLNHELIQLSTVLTHFLKLNQISQHSLMSMEDLPDAPDDEMLMHYHRLCLHMRLQLSLHAIEDSTIVDTATNTPAPTPALGPLSAPVGVKGTTLKPLSAPTTELQANPNPNTNNSSNYQNVNSLLLLSKTVGNACAADPSTASSASRDGLSESSSLEKHPSSNFGDYSTSSTQSHPQPPSTGNVIHHQNQISNQPPFIAPQPTCMLTTAPNSLRHACSMRDMAPPMLFNPPTSSTTNMLNLNALNASANSTNAMSIESNVSRLVIAALDDSSAEGSSNVVADPGNLSGNVAKLNVFLLNVCRIKKREKTMETVFEDNNDLRNPRFRATVSFPALRLEGCVAPSVVGRWQGNKMLAKEDCCYKALRLLEPIRPQLEALSVRTYRQTSNNNNNNNNTAVNGLIPLNGGNSSSTNNSGSTNSSNNNSLIMNNNNNNGALQKTNQSPQQTYHQPQQQQQLWRSHTTHLGNVSQLMRGFSLSDQPRTSNSNMMPVPSGLTHSHTMHYGGAHGGGNNLAMNLHMLQQQQQQQHHDLLIAQHSHSNLNAPVYQNVPLVGANLAAMNAMQQQIVNTTNNNNNQNNNNGSPQNPGHSHPKALLHSQSLRLPFGGQLNDHSSLMMVPPKDKNIHSPTSGRHDMRRLSAPAPGFETMMLDQHKWNSPSRRLEQSTFAAVFGNMDE